MLAGVMSAAMALSALTVMPSGTASADLLVSNGFESNYDGWYNVGDFTELKAAPQGAYHSSRGMAVTNRQNAADGAASDKGYYLDGGMRYAYSVYVKADTAETFTLTLSWLRPDGTRESAVIVKETANAGEWTKLSGSYAAPDDATDLTVTITTDSTNDFYFDSFKAEGKNKTWSRAEIEAHAADVGLKDIYANHFRVGTCVPNGSMGNSTITGIILREFNSVTCENELKPDATLVQNGSSNNNIKVSLSRAASIIDFCVQHNIAMRGHTFVWHSQTPSWFFKSDFNNGSWVDTSTMDQRMESYIHNMFDAIAEQYPDLNLYAYDVANECIKDGSSGPRDKGDNNTNSGTSAWVSVYGDNSFVKKAFTYAKKYRPEGCKLFYNDYNEYQEPKKTGIINLVKDLKAADVIDGVGMQSHLNADWPSVNDYRSALNTYADITGCVHITELDIAQANADRYKAIMQCALDNPAVEAFVVWGTTDGTSWRRGENCLLFNDNGSAKAAYNSLAAMIDPSDYGDGDNPAGGGKTPTIIEPDQDGCYFHNTFESDTERWAERGSDKVAQTSGDAYLGSGMLSVTGRQDTWNGAGRNLSSNPFKPGETFSFGAMVKYTEGEATQDIKLTLQYSADGDEKYAEVATVTAKKGEWVLVSNDSYQIPAGATGMLLYLETPDATIDFYVDEAYGGVEGAVPASLAGAQTTESTTTTTTTSTTETETTTTTTTATSDSAENPQKPGIAGDVDCSGLVELADAVMLAKAVAGIDVNLSVKGKANADTNSDGTLTDKDLKLLLQYLAGSIESL